MTKESLRWRTLLAFCLAAVLALGVAACGDDDDEDDGGGSAATPAETTGGTETGSAGGETGGDDGIAQAQAIVDKATKLPTEVGPTKPVGKPIPKGKKVVYVDCGQQACKQYNEGVQEAAKAIGWTVKTINVQPTPESIQAGFDQAVREKPDVVISAGFDVALYQRQAKELRDGGAMLASVTGRDKTGDNIDLQVLDAEKTSEATALAGAAAAADTGGEGTVGSILLTGYPIVENYTKAFEESVKKYCPKCEIKQLKIQPTSIGQDAGAKIANFVRSNSPMKGLWLSYDDLGIGLKAGLAGAGVTDVPKVYSWGLTQAGWKDLVNGDREAVAYDAFLESGWSLIYGAALWHTGQKDRVKEAEQVQDFVLLGKKFNNIPEDSTNPALVEGYQEKWKALLQ